MISSCPILECLLLKLSFGFTSVRISSSNLKSIGLGASYYGNCINKPNLRLQELIIVNAPCLERLLFLSRYLEISVSVIAAPKLETLGCLSDKLHDSRLVFGTTTIQGFQVTKLTAVVNNIRILAVKLPRINLDMVIDLLKCFPCLEKLYIKVTFLHWYLCCISGEMNWWHRKHRQFIECFDIHLKTIVLEGYQGIRSKINFASFFLLNASKLELMTLRVKKRDGNEVFFAEQCGVLQMEKRASRTARLHFTTESCYNDVHVNHLRDLVITNPFECRCWHSKGSFGGK
ncbi:unnamed protein product [Urochloa decumbens]|uniref:FBD domain-containing protein n=1 Tax=Urochloa decumbens TaxID=240449 RepID=A0ABC9FI67_9POAL